MRTDNPQTHAPVLARLRAPVARARRWVADRGAWTRLGLALVALAGLVAAGYYASPTEPAVDWIYAGHAFSPDEVEKILSVLAANNIKAESDGRGRIAVPTDRLAQAINTLDKQRLGPMSLEDIEETGTSPFLTSPSDRERQDLRKRERSLKYVIRALPGVVSADLILSPYQTRNGLRPTRTLRATVIVHTEGRGLLPTQTIKMIQHMICSMEPEIPPAGVTLVDDAGHTLLDAGDPAVGVQSIVRAREQELIGEIATELAWIEGVRVSLHLVAPTPTAVGPSAPSIGVNQPIDLGPAPEPAESGKAEDPARPAGEFGKAEVVVLVPTSYYRRIFRGNMPDREPTQADLEKLVEQTERAIRVSVANVIAPEERGKITIDKYPDVGPRPAAPIALATNPRPIRMIWVPAVVVLGVAVVALMIAGGRRLASRRPTPRLAASARREPFAKEDSSPAGPGPSDRVRELVRLDPEAAAGALQRWIGQGGHVG